MARVDPVTRPEFLRTFWARLRWLRLCRVGGDRDGSFGCSGPQDRGGDSAAS